MTVSTDNTAKIVKEIQGKDNRVIYFYQQNKRLGAARNSGFRLAKGQWIAFLDSDDLWDPFKLALQIKFVEENKVDVVFTDGYMLMEQTQEHIPYPTQSGWFMGNEMYKILFEKNIVPVLSVLMNSSWVKKIGYQNESLPIFGCEDWDYWLRIAKNNGIFYGMPEKLFYYRVHPGGMSRNNTIMKLAESTVLYDNIEENVFSIEFLRDRFQNLCAPIIPKLIELNRKEDAIRQLETLLSFNNKINYKLLYYYLKYWNNVNQKIIYNLLNPRYFLVRIRKYATLNLFKN